MRAEVYVSADVEADGPVPGPYSMLSFGLAVAGIRDEAGFHRSDPTQATFYAELQPISSTYDEHAVAVSGLERARLVESGTSPADAMHAAIGWIETVCAGRRPVLVAYPAVYDWMFLYHYLRVYGGRSPFGHSGCLDIKTMFATKAGVPVAAATKRQMPSHLLSQRRHTHHALDDAIEQAELFANIMEWQGAPLPPGR